MPFQIKWHIKGVGHFKLTPQGGGPFDINESYK